MSSRLIQWLAVVSLIFVLGGHWAILQSVAWVTMVAGYSQTDPISQALLKTFDGKHPCPLCNCVAKAKKAEQKQETKKLLSKLDFFLACKTAALVPPDPESILFAAPLPAMVRVESPPAPPPRSLRG